MNWDIHINSAITKASKRLYYLKILRRCNASSSVLWTVYCSIIRSVLIYGHQTFCNTTASNTAKLYRIERRAARIMNIQPSVTLNQFMNETSLRLARKINSDRNHLFYSMLAPLLPISQNLRNAPSRRPFAQTSRYQNSFIKYLWYNYRTFAPFYSTTFTNTFLISLTVYQPIRSWFNKAIITYLLLTKRNINFFLKMCVGSYKWPNAHFSNAYW